MKKKKITPEPQEKSLNEQSSSLEDFFTPSKINGQIQKEMKSKSDKAKRETYLFSMSIFHDYLPT